MRRSNKVAIAKAELVSLLNKDQPCVVRTRLKRMFAKAMNMSKELRVEELAVPLTDTLHISNHQMGESL